MRHGRHHTRIFLWGDGRLQRGDEVVQCGGHTHGVTGRDGSTPGINNGIHVGFPSVLWFSLETSRLMRPTSLLSRGMRYAIMAYVATVLH